MTCKAISILENYCVDTKPAIGLSSAEWVISARLNVINALK